MNADWYINYVLQSVVVPFVERHPNTIFRNDNVYVLIAPELSISFRRSTTSSESVASPLAQHEPYRGHNGDQLGKVLNGRIRPGDTLQGLGRFLTEKWRNLPQEIVTPSDIQHASSMHCTDWQLW